MPTRRGKAEGLKSTTNEIFDSYGIGPQIAAESWRLEEIAIWGQKKDGGESGIEREQLIQDKVEELGKVRETMLQQCRCFMFFFFRVSDSIHLLIVEPFEQQESNTTCSKTC